MILADHIIMFCEHAMMLSYVKNDYDIQILDQLLSTANSYISSTINGTSQIWVLPTTNALLMHGSSCLISSSIGTGGTFSPPAVTMISLIRPVMYKNPSESRFPTSPVLQYTKNDKFTF